MGKKICTTLYFSRCGAQNSSRGSVMGASTLISSPTVDSLTGSMGSRALSLPWSWLQILWTHAVTELPSDARHVSSDPGSRELPSPGSLGHTQIITPAHPDIKLLHACTRIPVSSPSIYIFPWQWQSWSRQLKLIEAPVIISWFGDQHSGSEPELQLAGSIQLVRSKDITDRSLWVNKY